MDQILGDMDPSVSEGEEDFMSGTYRCRDDIRLEDELFCCTGLPLTGSTGNMK